MYSLTNLLCSVSWNLSWGASASEPFEISPIYVNCLLDHRFIIPVHICAFSTCSFLCEMLFVFCNSTSPPQLLTWAVIAARSQTYWIKAFRSARSVLSSRPTTDSSYCAVFGTRASGFTPLTRVWSQCTSSLFALIWPGSHKTAELQLWKHTL